MQLIVLLLTSNCESEELHIREQRPLPRPSVHSSISAFLVLLVMCCLTAISYPLLEILQETVRHTFQGKILEPILAE